MRTLKTDQGERKYVVYVPEGYDGSKAFPVILFLHGAGERGTDGIAPSRVGIGPALLNRAGRRARHRRDSASARDMGRRLARR